MSEIAEIGPPEGSSREAMMRMLVGIDCNSSNSFSRVDCFSCVARRLVLMVATDLKHSVYLLGFGQHHHRDRRHPQQSQIMFEPGGICTVHPHGYAGLGGL